MSWFVNINSITWVAPPIGNQTVDISYREGGSSGYFSLVGTILVDPTGAIVGMPNPFVIATLDDAWDSVEIQAVNECNDIEVLTTYDKPL